MNKIIITLITLCSCNQAFAQGRVDYCHMAPILNDQIKCCQRLPSKDTLFYIGLLTMAPVIRPKVIGEIERQSSTNSLCTATHFNILEGYDVNSGDTYGLIWVDSIYYSYVNGPTTWKGLAKTSVVETKTYLQLTEEERAIVAHFNDWSNEIFGSSRKSPRYPTHPLYCIASRARFDNRPSIESIAFCY